MRQLFRLYYQAFGVTAIWKTIKNCLVPRVLSGNSLGTESFEVLHIILELTQHISLEHILLKQHG